MASPLKAESFSFVAYPCAGGGQGELCKRRDTRKKRISQWSVPQAKETRADKSEVMHLS